MYWSESTIRRFGSQLGRKLNNFRAKDVWNEVEHVKSRRTEKGKAANVAL